MYLSIKIKSKLYIYFHVGVYEGPITRSDIQSFLLLMQMK